MGRVAVDLTKKKTIKKIQAAKLPGFLLVRRILYKENVFERIREHGEV